MKNKIYITGLLSSMLIITGAIFKIMHMAGAGVLIILGITMLCLVFLPAATISSYKDNGRKKPLLYIAIFITIFVDFTGALFKIMHWSGAGILLFTGILAPIIIFLPVFLYFHFKEQEESNTNFLYIMFLLVYLSVMSSLLSLNITKDKIDDSSRSESIANLHDYYQIKKQFTNDSGFNELNKRTSDLINYINKLKIELAFYECDDKKSVVGENNKINVFKINNKDNTDIPEAIMIANGKGKMLKEKIGNYRSYLTGLLKAHQINSGILSFELLKTDDVKNHDENIIDWEVYQFEHVPLVFVIQKLTNIESNIIIAESEVILKIRQKTST